MSNIERIPNMNGEIELFGASQHLVDRLDVNFARRGEQAAQLLIATLTETPYVYREVDQEFAIPVSNRYLGAGDDEADTVDTVDVARMALAEFVNARVPGTRKVRLEEYATRYRKIWRDLSPGRTTPAHSVNSFGEAFVESARKKGVEIQSPEQGMRIIKTAPKYIVGLCMSDRPSYPRHAVVRHDVVTTAGHIVKIDSSRQGLLSEYVSYDLSNNVGERGGRAPSSRIASEIEARVVKLRTKHTER